MTRLIISSCALVLFFASDYLRLGVAFKNNAHAASNSNYSQRGNEKKSIDERLDTLEAVVAPYASLRHFLDSFQSKERYFAALQQVFGEKRIRLEAFNHTWRQLVQLADLALSPTGPDYQLLLERLWQLKTSYRPESTSGPKALIDFEIETNAEDLRSVYRIEGFHKVVEDYTLDLGNPIDDQAIGQLEQLLSDFANQRSSASSLKKDLKRQLERAQTEALKPWVKRILAKELLSHPDWQTAIQSQDPTMVTFYLNSLKKGRLSFLREANIKRALMPYENDVPLLHALNQTLLDPKALDKVTVGMDRSWEQENSTRYKSFRFIQLGRAFHSAFATLVLNDCGNGIANQTEEGTTATPRRWAIDALQDASLMLITTDHIVQGLARVVPVQLGGVKYYSLEFMSNIFAKPRALQIVDGLKKSAFSLFVEKLARHLGNAKLMIDAETSVMVNGGNLESLMYEPSVLNGTTLRGAPVVADPLAQVLLITRNLFEGPEQYGDGLIFDAALARHNQESPNPKFVLLNTNWSAIQAPRFETMSLIELRDSILALPDLGHTLSSRFTGLNIPRYLTIDFVFHELKRRVIMGTVTPDGAIRFINDLLSLAEERQRSEDSTALDSARYFTQPLQRFSEDMENLISLDWEQALKGFIASLQSPEDRPTDPPIYKLIVTLIKKRSLPSKAQEKLLEIVHAKQSPELILNFIKVTEMLPSESPNYSLMGWNRNADYVRELHLAEVRSLESFVDDPRALFMVFELIERSTLLRRLGSEVKSPEENAQYESYKNTIKQGLDKFILALFEAFHRRIKVGHEATNEDSRSFRIEINRYVYFVNEQFNFLSLYLLPQSPTTPVRKLINEIDYLLGVYYQMKPTNSVTALRSKFRNLDTINCVEKFSTENSGEH